MGNYNVRILGADEKDRKIWNSLLDSIPNKDIYFTPEYMKLFENLTGKAQLFVYSKDNQCILYPFFKRRINDLPFCEFISEYGELYDIISPWYYGGPISNISITSSDVNIWREFLSELHEYCINEKIVTEFTRFDPLLKNHLPLVKAGEKENIKEFKNRLFYLDLRESKETIWHNFKKSNKNSINKAKREDVKISISKENKDILAFYELYNTTMKRKGAKEKYRFPLQFYKDLFRTLRNNVTLFLAKFEGEIIAASLFLNKYDFVHYYLSGSNPEFLKKYPNNLLLYEAILWAKEQGYKIFDLGGGYQLNDSLFRFKASFSKNSTNSYTYGKIHNENQYKSLCEARDRFDRGSDKEIIETDDYFPQYRR